MSFISHIKINKSLHRPIRAFTLIETLTSIMIITTVILGPMTVANNASTYARGTKDTMTGIYLAQEALELLHHQQDSLYLRCVSQTSNACTPDSYETPSEAAWRYFRIRLGDNTRGPSCYTATNPAGCAYDFIDMTSNSISGIDSEDTFPVKYSGTDERCLTLSISAEHLYVCKGAHGTGAGFTDTPYARTVNIVSVPTFIASDQDAERQDDLRVTARVSFRHINGYTKQVRVVEFFHARS